MQHSLGELFGVQLECDSSHKPWLIERLWSAHAVGFVRSAKSLRLWTVLENWPFRLQPAFLGFGLFPVHCTASLALCSRGFRHSSAFAIAGAWRGIMGMDLDQIDIRVICADSLRLESPCGSRKTGGYGRTPSPALLVLDPLVRLHSLMKTKLRRWLNFSDTFARCNEHPARLLLFRPHNPGKPPPFSSGKA